MENINLVTDERSLPFKASLSNEGFLPNAFPFIWAKLINFINIALTMHKQPKLQVLTGIKSYC